jgi:hypothetical protein
MGVFLRVLFYSVTAFLFCELVFPPDSIVRGWLALLGLCFAFVTAITCIRLMRKV